jgi:hypothetical protein
MVKAADQRPAAFTTFSVHRKSAAATSSQAILVHGLNLVCASLVSIFNCLSLQLFARNSQILSKRLTQYGLPVPDQSCNIRAKSEVRLGQIA